MKVKMRMRMRMKMKTKCGAGILSDHLSLPCNAKEIPEVDLQP
jgi:hypothetical protein